jgi:hypothetical protein
MKCCDHTEWLSLHANGANVSLHESDRVQTLIADITNPEVQRPSLIVVFGSTAKAVALRELFGLKAKRAGNKRAIGEIHLHVNPSTVSYDRPLFLADGDFQQRQPKSSSSRPEKCHATTHHSVLLPHSSGLDNLADGLYCRLSYPFTDVFCFFAADLGGFTQISRRIAAWIERESLLTLPSSTYPKVIIVTDLVPSSPDQ